MVAGPRALSGSVVEAPDIRGGAALVVAGLVAEGCTEIRAVHHIDRGYEDLTGKLTAVGARLERMTADAASDGGLGIAAAAIAGGAPMAGTE